MGWSDISISIRGDAVGDLQAHFGQRWKLISQKEISIISSTPKYTTKGTTGSTTTLEYTVEDTNMPECTTGSTTLECKVEDTNLSECMTESTSTLKCATESTSTPKSTAESTSAPGCTAEGSTMQILRSCSMWSHGVSKEVLDYPRFVSLN